MEINDIIRKEALRRGLSNKTIIVYIRCVEKFFRSCDKEPKKVTKKDVRDFLDELIEKNHPGNTINVYNNALKFLFEQCLGKKMRLNIRYSKKAQRLPIVLTQEETKRLICSISNEKHKLMIKLMYSAGLRVSELLNLRVRDLELNSGYGWVRQGKGKKDRPFILAEKVKYNILEYINKNKLKLDSFMFISNRNKPYNVRSVQNIVRNAAKKAKLNKKFSCHTLRHSFATHLIENGYSVSEVQSLLGHNSLDTTMIYVHLASPRIMNVKSPLDNL